MGRMVLSSTSVQLRRLGGGENKWYSLIIFFLEKFPIDVLRSLAPLVHILRLLSKSISCILQAFLNQCFCAMSQAELFCILDLSGLGLISCYPLAFLELSPLILKYPELNPADFKSSLS